MPLKELGGVITPKIAMLISEFKQEIEESMQQVALTDEDTSAFRKRYQNDVKKLFDLLPYNPLKLDSLTKINNTSVTYSLEVKTALKDMRNWENLTQKIR